MNNPIATRVKNAVDKFKQGFALVTVGKTSETKERADIKRYIGLGQVQILCVNPTSAEIEKYMGFKPKEEPTYTSTTEIDGNKFRTARINMIIKTIADKCNGIDTTTFMSFNLTEQYVLGSQSNKYQVMDDYGRDAWATKETITSKAQIMYTNGPANIALGYHPIYRGEKALINFLRTYLSVPQPANYVNGSWIDKTGADLAECVLKLDSIKALFDGNFKEIKDAVALQPTNRVKVLFGIREGQDNNGNTREYQDVYSDMVLPANSSTYTRIQKDIEDRKANGSLSNRTYEFTDIHEYGATATNLTEKTDKVADPFATAAAGATPWGE